MIDITVPCTAVAPGRRQPARMHPADARRRSPRAPDTTPRTLSLPAPTPLPCPGRGADAAQEHNDPERFLPAAGAYTGTAPSFTYTAITITISCVHGPAFLPVLLPLATYSRPAEGSAIFGARRAA